MFFWFIGALIAVTLVYTLYIVKFVLGQDTGTAKMREISAAITEGANAFLRRQYATIGILAAAVAGIILALYAVNGQVASGLQTAFAFALGAFCSALAGYIGMWISIR